MLFTDTARHNFAKDPAVVKFKGTYYLYYTVLYTREPLHIGVGIATSPDMENWTCVGEVPQEFEYEKKGIGAPAAIVMDGKLHLFYQTYGGWRTDAICHATSEDGLHFTKNPANPILRPNANWCAGRAIDADVCLFGGRLYLYYATRDHEMKIQKIGGAYADPSSDLAPDTWTQIADQALLAPEYVWEGECIEAPATVVNDGKIFLFYGGAYNCCPQQIGYAVSTDGAFFKKMSAVPLIPCGAPGSWNACESGHPYAFRDDDGRVYLFYQGTADMGKTWYISRAELALEDDRAKVIRFFI